MEYITAASILVTEDCNMACKYCFEHPRIYKNKMSKDVGLATVDFMFDQSKKSAENSAVNLTFFGGEPMCNFELIRLMTDKAIETSLRQNIPLECGIITNGTIIEDEHVEYLRSVADDVALNIQLSVDLTPEAHDMFRVFKDGTGTFKTIENNLPKWREVFGGKKDDSLHVHSCLNSETMKYMKEGYKYFREVWDMIPLWFIPIIGDEYTEENLKEYEDGLRYIKNWIVREIKQTGNFNLYNSYAPLNRCRSRSHGIPCGAGRNYATITSKGEIFPCHHIYFTDPNRESFMGDIFTEVDESRQLLYTEYDHTDLSCYEEMPNCDAFECYRCIADYWCIKGSLFSVVRGSRCDMSHIEKKIQRELKSEVDQLKKSNRRR